MAKIRVLLEFDAETPEAFSAFDAAAASESEAIDQAESLLARVAGLGVDLEEELTPVPMFIAPDKPPHEIGQPTRPAGVAALSEFAISQTNPDVTAATTVIAAEIERSAVEDTQSRPGVRVWPNSDLQLLGGRDLLGAVGTGATADSTVVGKPEDEAMDAFDLARSRVGTDCRPFRPAATIGVIRALLGTRRVWDDGFRGQNVAVGVLDEGIDGAVYPVAGGLRRSGAPAPGTAPITSHGSMCAADVLLAAPAARLFDYPFLGQPRSGGALAMFQAVLEQRRLDGTPQLTNNSYGFTGVPPLAVAPRHEVHDLDHPLHRKIREVTASGALAFFAAGNCGENCPSGNCHPSGIGPGMSIHASNSLAEVITIAAVNSRHERIGYSSQGPGMFVKEKPDLACYSHIFANFGPGRPGGTQHQPFDSGTSAATPVACGIGALMLSAFPNTTPERLKAALVHGATRLGSAPWDAGYGGGVVNAAATYRALDRGLV